MILASFLLEDSFHTFVVICFSVPPDGVLMSSIFGILVLALPVTCAVELIRKYANYRTAATIFLLLAASVCALIVSLLRSGAYAAELRRVVPEVLGRALTFIPAQAILATWVPFLLATGGLFMLCCALIWWKPELLTWTQKALQKARRWPADPRVRWWFVVLALAAVARLVWILLVPTQPAEDFRAYHELAARLSRGLGYVKEAGTQLVPTAYRPVGYPFFLSLIYRVCGPSIAAAKVAGLLLGLATVALSYLLGRLCVGERAAKVAALIIALIPGQVVYANFLATETLSTPLLLASIYIVIRYRENLLVSLAAGALIGATALVRPPVLTLPAVVLVYYLASRMKPVEALASFALIMAGMLVVLSPWMARNYMAFRRLIWVSTNGGTNLFIGNNPAATGTHVRVMHMLKSRTEIERNDEAFSKALCFIADNPGTFLVLGVKKVYYLYEGDLLPMNWSFYSVKGRDALRVSATYITQAAYLLAMLAAAAGLWMWLRRRTLELLLPALVIAAWTFMHFVYQGDNRYHVPVIPLFALFSAVAVLKALGWSSGEDSHCAGSTRATDMNSSS